MAQLPCLPNSLPLPCFFTPVAQLLYQEYSDVVLNKEIQSQQRPDSLAEAHGHASLQHRRKPLASSESYLQRFSMASSGSLWQEIPVVRNSTVLLSMTHEDQKLQEVLSRAEWAGDGDTGGKAASSVCVLASYSPPPPRAGSTHHTLMHTTTIGHLHSDGFELLSECHHHPSCPPPHAMGHLLLPLIGLGSY